MDDRYLVDLSDSQQNAFLQFVSGLHTNSPEERASHLAKQGFHDVQPGAMRGSQHVFESIGASRQKGSGLIRDMGGMVVEGQSNRALRQMVSIQVLGPPEILGSPTRPSLDV